MSPGRRAAVFAGILYLITHVTSVGARILYMPFLEDPSLATRAEPLLVFGMVLEVILAAAVVGTSVALYPLLRDKGPHLAIGYVGLRTLEAAVIGTGAAAMFAVILTDPGLNGSDGLGGEPILEVVDIALIQVVEAAFILGPGLICSFNTVVITTLLYRKRLVPRIIPMLGLIGGPLVFVWNVGLMLNIADASNAFAIFFVVPIFAWEISFAIYLIARGIRDSGTAHQEVPLRA
ncbi:DUF4386 domain-containing protein [Enteractinococcus coprophilus]|uniref:Uncharacterized protein DUF4386 n=1 Tax=Enteractinococcus coprophilus TaxID=1027633 RepID=A0A543A0D4_9MICC|nr:DUF4386 domain-containing protein [Enteractinococcus coprophilus]TQL66038.1 uncharacterized protein DUF4386 [Enteractinococcus coprophilus]